MVLFCLKPSSALILLLRWPLYLTGQLRDWLPLSQIPHHSPPGPISGQLHVKTRLVLLPRKQGYVQGSGSQKKNLNLIVMWLICPEHHLSYICESDSEKICKFVLTSALEKCDLHSASLSLPSVFSFLTSTQSRNGPGQGCIPQRRRAILPKMGEVTGLSKAKKYVVSNLAMS